MDPAEAYQTLRFRPDAEQAAIHAGFAEQRRQLQQQLDQAAWSAPSAG